MMDSWCEVISSNKKAKFSLHQGLSVGELIDRVADKFHYPPSSIRLFFSGKELKPRTALVEKFEIGKYGNFLLHLSTTTIEIVEDVLPLTTSVGHTIDLTLPGADTVSDTLVDLTTSPSIKRKRPRLITNHESSIEDSHLLENQVSIKTLRINILRALNHRLCILENQIINPSFNSERALITVQFLVQDSGVAQRYHVRIGLYVSCNCENMKNCPCPHILFILIKVFKLSIDHNSVSRYPLMFSADELIELFTSKGYLNQQDSGVIYCGISKPQPSSAIIEEPECSICLRPLIVPTEKFEVGDELVSCKICCNKLHLYCLKQWQERSETCPNCRSLWKKMKKKTNLRK